MKMRDNKALEDKLASIFAEATERKNRELAEHLLQRRKSSLGFSLLAAGCITLAIALIFHDSQPRNTLFVSTMGVVVLFAGFVHIDAVNRARRKLAEKLLKRPRTRPNPGGD